AMLARSPVEARPSPPMRAQKGARIARIPRDQADPTGTGSTCSTLLRLMCRALAMSVLVLPASQGGGALPSRALRTLMPPSVGSHRRQGLSKPGDHLGSARISTGEKCAVFNRRRHLPWATTLVQVFVVRILEPRLSFRAWPRRQRRSG